MPYKKEGTTPETPTPVEITPETTPENIESIKEGLEDYPSENFPEGHEEHEEEKPIDL